MSGELPNWFGGEAERVRKVKVAKATKQARRLVARRTWNEAKARAARDGLEIRVCDAPTCHFQIRGQGWFVNYWATTCRLQGTPGVADAMTPPPPGDLVALVREAARAARSRREARERARTAPDTPKPPLDPNEPPPFEPGTFPMA